MSYDLLIKNGTIVDGTGEAPYRGDLAVRDGKIVAINDDIESAVRYAMMMLRYAVSDDAGGRLASQPAFDVESERYDPLADHSHQSVQSPWMR